MSTIMTLRAVGDGASSGAEGMVTAPRIVVRGTTVKEATNERQLKVRKKTRAIEFMMESSLGQLWRPSQERSKISVKKGVTIVVHDVQIRQRSCSTCSSFGWWCQKSFRGKNINYEKIPSKDKDTEIINAHQPRNYELQVLTIPVLSRKCRP